MSSMSSDEEREEQEAHKLKLAKYSKLLPDGKLDPNSLEEHDYTLVKKFMSVAFPYSTKVQRELEESLKRTFILGRSNKRTKKSKKPLLSAKKGKNSQSQSRHSGPNNNKGGISKNKLKKHNLYKRVPIKLPYSSFEDLNEIWKEYIGDLFCLQNPSKVNVSQVQEMLNKVDLHGAFILVYDSSCKEYAQLKGIVVKETRNTFVIVTKDDKTKTIPKAETIFDVQIEGGVNGTMRIVGNSFMTRPAERVTKKIKSYIDFVGKKKYIASLKYADSQFQTD